MCWRNEFCKFPWFLQYYQPRALLARTWCGQKNNFQLTSRTFDSRIDSQTTATCVSQKRARWADFFFKSLVRHEVSALWRDHSKQKIFFFSCPQPLVLDSLGDSPQTTASNWHHSTASIIIAARVLVLSSAVSGNNRRRPHPLIALLLALHRYRGGRGRTAQAPRGEGRARPSAIASRLTLPPDSLSYLLVRMFSRKSSASGWGKLKKKVIFFENPKGTRLPRFSGIDTNRQFYFIYWLLLLMYLFRRISDSRFMILKNNLPNLFGLCHFPLNT